MRLLLIVLLPVLLPQDADKVTLEKKARFSVLVAELSRASGCKFKIQEGVEDKELAVSIRGAGLFQALDALCRAHGNAGTFDPRGGGDGEDHPEILIRPIAWTEYPSAYSGTFKVAATHYVRRRLRTEGGGRDLVLVHLALFAPPSIRVDWGGGARLDWSFSSARDVDGKDVLPPKDEGESSSPKVTLYAGLDWGTNVAEETATLREFDLDRGLSLLRGSATLTVPDTREIRIPLDPGREAVTPAGTLAVESVKPHGDDEWRVLLRLKDAKPAARLETAFLDHGKIEHDTGWTYLAVSGETRTIEARVVFVRAKPGWIKLYAREGERKIEVPFELKDIRFPKK